MAKVSNEEGTAMNLKEIPSTSADSVVYEIDMENRDPNGINDHLTVTFEEVFGEPGHSHSTDCVWRNSYKCFSFTKTWCYKILTILCGITTAFCWGCEFAAITFCHVWYVAPCYRFAEMNILCCKKYYSVFIHCLCDPFCEAFGMMFAAFKRN